MNIETLREAEVQQLRDQVHRMTKLNTLYRAELEGLRPQHYARGQEIAKLGRRIAAQRRTLHKLKTLLKNLQDIDERRRREALGAFGCFAEDVRLDAESKAEAG